MWLKGLNLFTTKLKSIDEYFLLVWDWDQNHLEYFLRTLVKCDGWFWLWYRFYWTRLTSSRKSGMGGFYFSTKQNPSWHLPLFRSYGEVRTVFTRNIYSRLVKGLFGWVGFGRLHFLYRLNRPLRCTKLFIFFRWLSFLSFASVIKNTNPKWLSWIKTIASSIYLKRNYKW